MRLRVARKVYLRMGRVMEACRTEEHVYTALGNALRRHLRLDTLERAIARVNRSWSRNERRAIRAAVKRRLRSTAGGAAIIKKHGL